IGAVHNGLRSDCGKVVAIKRDVEYADRWTIAFEVRDLLRHAFGKRHAASSDSNEKQVSGAGVFFDHFGRQTRQRTIDARAIHDTSLLDKIHVRAILTRSAVSRKGRDEIFSAISAHLCDLCVKLLLTQRTAELRRGPPRFT